MPLTFEALKRQRFRWCFGGVQILRAHWRSLLPWDRCPSNQLTQRQRYAYLAGGLQWFADTLGLLFIPFALAGAIGLAAGDTALFRSLSSPFLVVPLAALGFGVVRAVTVLQRRTTATLRDAVGALGIWLALSCTVTLACFRALTQPAGVFLRTPKVREQPRLRDALHANRVESGLGTLLGAAAVVLALDRHTAASVILCGLLGWQAAGLLSAPLNSLAAMRAELPDQLRRRRRTEWLREQRVKVRPVPVLLTSAVGAIAAGVMVLFIGGTSTGAIAPNVLHEGHAAKPTRQPQSNNTGPAPLKNSASPTATASPTSPTTVAPATPPHSPGTTATPSPSASPAGTSTTPSPAPAASTASTSTSPLPSGSTSSTPAQPTASSSNASTPPLPTAASSHPTPSADATSQPTH